jgi:hypothetical protein
MLGKTASMDNIFQAEDDAKYWFSGGSENIKQMLATDKPKQKTETTFPFFGHGKIASCIGITDNSLLLKKSNVECPNMKNTQPNPINKDVTIRYPPNVCRSRRWAKWALLWPITAQHFHLQATCRTKASHGCHWS